MMRKKGRKIIYLLCAVFMCSAILMSCGKANSIVGTWAKEEGEEVIIFEEDGTCSLPFTYSSGWIESLDRYSIIEEDVLVLSSSRGNLSSERYTRTNSEEEVTDNLYYYYLSNDVLIIHDHNTVRTYKRK